MRSTVRESNLIVTSLKPLFSGNPVLYHRCSAASLSEIFPHVIGLASEPGVCSSLFLAMLIFCNIAATSSGSRIPSSQYILPWRRSNARHPPFRKPAGWPPRMSWDGSKISLKPPEEVDGAGVHEPFINILVATRSDCTEAPGAIVRLVIRVAASTGWGVMLSIDQVPSTLRE